MGLGRVDRNGQRKANFGVSEMLREDAEALKCRTPSRTEPKRESHQVSDSQYQLPVTF
jgi:hypothetical protein